MRLIPNLSASTSGSPATLPADFPANLPAPRFQIGDRVRWHPIPAEDFGTIVGLTYTPAPNHSTWHWQYTIWLDADSPSRDWVNSEIAWEPDLELLTDRGTPTADSIGDSGE